jgi:hypothetical protein
MPLRFASSTYWGCLRIFVGASFVRVSAYWPAGHSTNLKFIHDAGM